MKTILYLLLFFGFESQHFHNINVIDVLTLQDRLIILEDRQEDNSSVIIKFHHNGSIYETRDRKKTIVIGFWNKISGKYYMPDLTPLLNDRKNIIGFFYDGKIFKIVDSKEILVKTAHLPKITTRSISDRD